MKRPSCSILVALQLAGTWIAAAQADTGLSTSQRAQVILASAYQARPGNDPARPAVVISPRVLDFGSVPVGTIKELSFKVRNTGAGTLSGAASVSAPFNIPAGSRYVLNDPETQVITVQYAPKSIGIHMAVVHLTDGVTVTVMGSAAPLSHRTPARRISPTDPPGLKLIALNY